MINVTKLLTQQAKMALPNAASRQAQGGVPYDSPPGVVLPPAGHDPMQGAFVPRDARATEARPSAIKPFTGLAFTDEHGEIVASLPLDNNARVGTHAFSPDRAKVAVAVLTLGWTKYEPNSVLDRTVRVFDTQAAKELVRFRHLDASLSLSWAPDGRWLAVGTGRCYSFPAHMNIVDAEARTAFEINDSDVESDDSGVSFGEFSKLNLSWSESAGRQRLHVGELGDPNNF